MLCFVNPYHVLQDLRGGLPNQLPLFYILLLIKIRRGDFETGSHFAVQAGLELMILLPQPLSAGIRDLGITWSLVLAATPPFPLLDTGGGNTHS